MLREYQTTVMKKKNHTIFAITTIISQSLACERKYTDYARQTEYICTKRAERMRKKMCIAEARQQCG